MRNAKARANENYGRVEWMQKCGPSRVMMGLLGSALGGLELGLGNGWLRDQANDPRFESKSGSRHEFAVHQK